MRNKRQLTVSLILCQVAQIVLQQSAACAAAHANLLSCSACVLQMKQQRKEVADLIRANKQGNARIRVEAVIRDSQTLQAYELIELFLELMAVRVRDVARGGRWG